MQDVTTSHCLFPDHRGSTGYGYGCRCDRCRSDWATSTRLRRHRAAGMQSPRTCQAPGCDAPVAGGKGNHKHCGDCKPARGYKRMDHRVFACAAPGCYNMCSSSHRDAKFCSESCSAWVKNVRRRGQHRSTIHPHWVMSQPVAGPLLTDWPMFGPTKRPNIPQTPPPTSCRVHFGKCELCGNSFAGRHPHKRFCSRFCLKKASKARRNATKRGAKSEPYTLRSIAERDGWRCHLCGGKVPDQKYAARDNDATVDHLVPVSHGGDDIRSNVALAHNRCNWERGNAGLAQLRLVG